MAHPSGQAISLLEKQNSLLRQEAASNRERLHHLIATARDNDHLFMRLRALVLILIEAKDWSGVLSSLEKGLTQHFDVDAVRLLATAPWVPEQPPLVQRADSDELAEQHPKVVRGHKCWCGQLDPEQMQMVFGKDTNMGSVAMAPLIPPGQGTSAVLVLGAKDPDYFRSSMNTLFLNHVADVVSRLMVIWLPVSDD